MGRLEGICISRVKGVIKDPVPQARLVAGHGLEGDAHAGDWHRQVSLLARESIERVKQVLPDLTDGAFAENLITSGVDWRREARVGDRVRVGRAELEVTQIGKECHAACAIGVATGDCIMPKEGIFCRVLVGAEIRPGDELLHEPQAAP